MKISAKFRFTILGLLIGSCSDAEFASQNSKKGDPAELNGTLFAEFLFYSGEKSMKIAAQFRPKAGSPAKAATFHNEYTLVSGSLKAESNGGFPDDLAKKISLSPITATVDKTNSTTAPYTIVFNFENPKVTITQTSKTPDWNKEESDASQFGVIPGSAITPNSTNCKIESSGDQPRLGVHAVVLTKPAPCDFKLPSVKVGGQLNNSSVTVAIGRYWRYGHLEENPPRAQIAHNFPLTASPVDAKNRSVHIDNGFILIQPDGTSFLLVDAGIAMSQKTAESIASDLSESLGFGKTILKQPSPGSSSDNYASATLFKKGSVIALYDDTPDMGGEIDVSALIEASAAGPGGLSLKWNATSANPR